MDEKRFSVGDTVYLRSSAEPLMTVSELNGNEIKCVWFDRDLKLRMHVFNSAMLEATAPGLTIVINTGDGEQAQNVDGGKA